MYRATNLLTSFNYYINKCGTLNSDAMVHQNENFLYLRISGLVPRRRGDYLPIWLYECLFNILNK